MAKRQKITVTIDTNCIRVRNSDQNVKRLFELEEENKIEIIKTDVLDTELSDKGREHSKDIPEDLGMGICDNSRIEHCVIGGDEDDVIHKNIMLILFPETKGEEPNNNKIRDVMHLTTHKKHNRDIFVTNDDDFLRNHNELKKLDIIVMNPEQCVQYIGNDTFET